jgi:hypothetical protein
MLSAAICYRYSLNRNPKTLTSVRDPKRIILVKPYGIVATSAFVTGTGAFCVNFFKFSLRLQENDAAFAL